MRVAFLTTDDPLYYPHTLAPVLRRWRKHITLVAFVAQPHSLLKRILDHLAFLGLVPFIRIVMMALGRRFWRRKEGPPPTSRLCHALGLPVVRVPKLNTSWFLNLLSERNVDLIVSVGCPQIIGKDILSLPRLGTINVHCAPLPRYRGLMPTFWCLLHGEGIGAVTVHFANERIDDGPIVLQRQFKIAPKDSLHDALLKAKREAAEALSEVLHLCERNIELPRHPNPREEATYFSFPDRKARRNFLLTGRRLI